MRRVLKGVVILVAALTMLPGCGGGDDDENLLSPPGPPDENVGEGNRPPVAIAGQNLTAPVGSEVRLDASASTDPEEAPLSFSWTLEKPPGSNAVLNDSATATPVFVPDVTGIYRARLQVSDGTATDEDFVEITAQAPADAGPDRTVAVGELVLLDARNSLGPGGRRLSFNWLFVERPLQSRATLTVPDGPTTSFTADQPGRYTVRLTVTDERGASASDDVSIVAGPTGILEGQQLYDTLCALCHSLGNYDRNATPGAPDLSGKGTRLPFVFNPAHAGIVLTPEEVSALQAFLDTQ